MSLIIDPKDMPTDEGVHLEGQLPASVFELATDDFTQAISPLGYSLDVFKDEADIILAGRLEATFDLECGRCGERFHTKMEINDYGQAIPLENDALIDLTIYLREDMLLALPTYPRCETGNVNPRECPAEGKFETALDIQNDELAEAKDKKNWEALDQLNNLKSN